MKYLSVQREKSRKYSQRWQQQHTADELKTIAAAVNYLSEPIDNKDPKKLDEVVGIIAKYVKAPESDIKLGLDRKSVV